MQLKIRGYSFQLSEPFQPGTVITKGEAQALNDLRAENIGNNIRKLVAKAAEGLSDGALLSAEALAEIQQKITSYDLNYQFLEKDRARARLGDIEAEARAIARERVEESLRRQGQELSEEELEEAIGEMAGLPAVRDAARDRVQAKRQALADSISDL